MSKDKAKITDREAAASLAIETLHESIAENVDPDSISLTGIAIELFLVALSLSDTQTLTACGMVYHYCMLVGIEPEDCQSMALSLFRDAQYKIGERN